MNEVFDGLGAIAKLFELTGRRDVADELRGIIQRNGPRAEESTDAIHEEALRWNIKAKDFVDLIECSTRVANVIHQTMGEWTVFQLANTPDFVLLKMKNFGRRTLTELNDHLMEYGMPEDQLRRYRERRTPHSAQPLRMREMLPWPPRQPSK